MSALSDPFIRYVLELENKFSDDTRRDIADGWDFNPDSIPGPVALVYRMAQLKADWVIMDEFWSVLADYARERPDDVVSAMRELADWNIDYAPIADRQNPVRIRLAQLEADDDWVTP
ncbi:hypothetical protein ACFY15_07530 [Streptomyces sp. NPDC001373]|uniref:hypothetical protein n=1 Tax=Streptomyces sp. NPDC001373 TaxID=3364565 RepID=UPI0036C2E2CE